MKTWKASISLSSFVIGIVSCVTLSKTLAQLPPESPIFPQEEPEVILKKVCNTLSTKKAFTVDIDIAYDNVLDSGEKIQYSAFQQIWLKRPNKMKVDYSGDERHTSFYYDGKTFTLLANKLNLYTHKPALPTIDDAIAQMEEKYDVTIPLANLFVSDPCKKVIPVLNKSTYVGFDIVNRVPSYHFLFTGKDKDFQIWIDTQTEPILQKVVITYKELPASPQYTAIFSNWNFNPQIPTEIFNFTPPAGSGKIDFFYPPETK